MPRTLIGDPYRIAVATDTGGAERKSQRVRGGLARALAAGERLVILEQRTGCPLPREDWPPRIQPPRT
jgi:hypothetical protein